MHLFGLWFSPNICPVVETLLLIKKCNAVNWSLKYKDFLCDEWAAWLLFQWIRLLCWGFMATRIFLLPVCPILVIHFDDPIVQFPHLYPHSYCCLFVSAPLTYSNLPANLSNTNCDFTSCTNSNLICVLTKGTNFGVQKTWVQIFKVST